MEKILELIDSNLETILFFTTTLFILLAVVIVYVLLSRRQGVKNKKEAFELNSQDVVRNLWSNSYINKVRIGLKNAGRKIGAEQFVFIKFMITLVVGMIILIASLNVIVAAIFALIANLLVKEFVISSRVNAKRKKIDKAVLPFFETLSLAVQSGAGLEKAIELTCHYVDDSILVEEFERVLADAKYGLSMEEALFGLMDRIPSQMVVSTISSIINALEIGAPMSKTLKSEIFRIRQILVDRAEEQAAKSGQRIVIPLVFTMLPSLIILLAGPAVLRALSSFI